MAGTEGATGGRVRGRGSGRTLPAIIAAALAATLAADIALLVSWRPDRPSGDGDLVSVEGNALPRVPPVAPLTKRYTPHLLVAADGPLPADAVERTRRLKGVAGITVVDAARAQVGDQRLGVLGVDPSTFRAFAPEQTARSDQLWQTIATGGLAVSFAAGRNGSLPLGGVVQAGRGDRPGRVRVGAYAAMGIGDVDAVVSREQARALGMPQGNAIVVSAPKTDTKALTERLRRILPRGTRFAPLNTASRTPSEPRAPRQAEVAARPDGVQGVRSVVTGNMMTRTMRDLVMEIDTRFGPFPTIGCFRSGTDAQDHAHGKACDFMESVGGRMPSASAMRHGDQVAQYAISNARRLGVSYVIWKQHIWNVRGGGWRPMADRGSLTQNHYDHVHISVLR
ncbi:hypothetical protein Acsp03_43070 [Actinomadura sp. NBRC 104412]|uniref:hypothetical protein n=1 Tax=Actinomadura sp. NBRC 104412 TaxID=3032203 RepID=UPI0024A1EAE5|nr:hypothetical protein [Actinomadura sp. NBRC 104412]GLZ06841.1 hypothetical protein Acsp03_43070 [Actinomadura sp. NBRC 104412]